MTTYVTAGHQPEVAHRPTPHTPHRFLCNGSTSLPVLLDDWYGYRPCRLCDGAAFGMFVYRCYRADGAVLYIGATNNIVGRFGLHANTPWWADVARLDLDGPYEDRFAMLRAEAEAIAAERPLLNRRRVFRVRDLDALLERNRRSA